MNIVLYITYAWVYMYACVSGDAFLWTFDKNKVVIQIFKYFIFFLSNKSQIICTIKYLYNFDKMYISGSTCASSALQWRNNINYAKTILIEQSYRLNDRNKIESNKAIIFDVEIKMK